MTKYYVVGTIHIPENRPGAWLEDPDAEKIWELEGGIKIQLRVEDLVSDCDSTDTEDGSYDLGSDEEGYYSAKRAKRAQLRLKNE